MAQKTVTARRRAGKPDLAQRSANRLGARGSTSSGEHLDAQSSERPDTPSSERPDVPSSERPGAPSGERPQSTERPSAQSSERLGAQPGGRRDAKRSEHTAAPPAEGRGGRPIERAFAQRAAPAGARVRVAIVGSPDRRLGACATMKRLAAWLRNRADVVFEELTYDAAAALPHGPELLFVLGGDGTLITAVRDLAERQVPIVGVNIGKLGYLADFSIEQIEQEGDFLFNGPLPMTRRVMLDVRMQLADGTTFQSPAVNDCVIHAGRPFRMVQISVIADGDEVVEVSGDGLIVATPSGSTAHNLAAGGPILEPTASSVILTPICPHALTYRPLTMAAERRIELRLRRANKSTTAVIDGRTIKPFAEGDVIRLTRYAADFLLVRNPSHSEWHALRHKLKWGELPNFRR